jgi:hypothetical protein
MVTKRKETLEQMAARLADLVDGDPALEAEILAILDGAHQGVSVKSVWVEKEATSEAEANE